MKNAIFFFLNLVFIVGLAIFYFRPQEVKKQAGMPSTEAEFHDKLAEYRMEREKLERTIKKLEDGKAKAIETLKKNNITKVADVKGNFEAEIALKDLKASTEKIDDLKSQFAHYDNAISRIDGMLNKFERDRVHSEAKLSEAQEIELRSIVKKLNEDLEIGKDDPLLDAELDEMLQDTLGTGN
jgi:septal ring factor EnvC (AmiA/AmiB activator)